MKMRRHPTTVLLTLAVILCTTLAQAQLRTPRADGKNRTSNLTQARATRTVYVDSTAGSGDFSTLGDAITYVKSQSPSASSRWTILVSPGNSGLVTGNYSYTETSISPPNYTSIVGTVDSPVIDGNGYGLAAVKLTGTSGALISCGESVSITNMMFIQAAATTAAMQLLGCPSGSTSLQNVLLISSGTASSALDLINVSGGVLQAQDLYLLRSASGTNTRNIHVSNGVFVAVNFRSYPGTAQTTNVTVAGGVVYLFDGRLEPAATTDVAQTGGAARVERVQYATESGTVGNGAVARSDLSLADSMALTPLAAPPYTCDSGAAGRIYYDSTTPSPCWCNGATWTPFVTSANCS